MPEPTLPAARPWHVALAGMVSLAVAMGIGRFAFTPLLPMMLADGVVDLPTASWLASANYLGYLVGALLCTFQPWRGRPEPTRFVRGALVATVLLTLAMALHLPGAWAALRFAAGVASAVAFVYTSGWCLGQLAQMGVPAMGALIYTGPGAGIVASGLAGSAMVALHWTSAAGWAVFGVLAALLVAPVWGVFRGHASTAQAASPAASSTAGATGHGPVEVGLLALAYGIAGFGYIITATFLPVIARQALPGSPWLDLFWPIFGAGVVTGAIVASRIRVSIDLRWLLVGCYVVQAIGVASSLVSATLAGFAVGSLLLGLPFTAITFFAMQEVRRVRPTQVARSMGLLTAVYGLGQIIGPPLAAGLVQRAGNAARGFTLALEIAAASLALGALLFALLAKSYPANPASAR
jgi:predicted MFS family arabinose efflux permease